MNQLRENRKVIKWNLLFYSLNFIYTIMVGLILVPIYLTYIPKDLYGYWLATGNLLTIISLIDPGIGAVMTQKISYSYGKMDRHSVGCYGVNGVSLSLVVALTIFFIGTLLGGELSALLNIPNEYQDELLQAFNYTLAGTSLMIVYYSIGAIAYGMLSSKCIGFINLFANILGLVLIVYFFQSGYGLLSIGYSSLIRSLIYLLGSTVYIGYRFVTEKIIPSFDLRLMKVFFRLSFYNFFGSFGQNLLANVNSVVCTKFISPLDSANLKFTQTVPDMGKMIVLRVLASFNPSISNLYGANQKEQLDSILCYLLKILIWLLGLVFVGFLFLNKSFVSIWIGADNYCGGISNLLVVILLLFSTINRIISQIIFNMGNIKINNLVMFIQAIFYILLVIPIAIYFKIDGILFLSIGVELLAFYFYYMRRIIEIFNSKEKMKGLLSDVFQTIIVVIFISIIVLIIDYIPVNWIHFIAVTLLLIAFYFSCLGLVSASFRNIFLKLVTYPK